MRIALLLYPGCLPAGLLATTDLLHGINQRLGRRQFECHWTGATAEPVPLAGGLQLQAAQTLAQTLDQSAADVLLIPGSWAQNERDLDALLAAQAGLIAQLRRLRAGMAVWTYCMGVALAAAAGLFDGHPATASWWFRQTLQQRHPEVDWRFDQPVVHARRRASAAAANGYLGLLLDYLAATVPAAVLNDVQQALLLPRPLALHPAFHPVELAGLRDPALQRLLAYAFDTPAGKLDLAAAANHLNTSTRTLSRRVQEATGHPAGAWLRLAKLRQASDLLLTTNHPAKGIAAILGYTDETALHRAFKQATGCTLQEYRRRYG